MRFKYLFFTSIVFFIVLFVLSCKSTKFVDDDKYLLDNVSIDVENKVINKDVALTYVAQKPNYKTFQIFKFPLFLYNLSGKNDSGFVSRTLRNAGEAPVIFDSTLVSKTKTTLYQMAFNKGFLDAEVEAEIEYKPKKVDIKYIIDTYDPYKVDTFRISMPDSVFQKPDSLEIYGVKHPSKVMELGNIDSIMLRQSLIKKGERFDLDLLSKERDKIVSMLRTFGYYSFSADFVSFEVDTLSDKKEVNINTIFYPVNIKNDDGSFTQIRHKQYVVKEVNIDLDYDVYKVDQPHESSENRFQFRGYNFLYGKRGVYIKPTMILRKCFISPNNLYSEHLTTQTYNALSELNILSNINISYIVDNGELICNITATPKKKQEISTELEGTNSEGFFGMGAGVSYMHRNLFKHSEMFKVGVKGEYTMITPNFSNFDDNYFEIGAETSFAIPEFKLPFVSRDFKRSTNATTQLTASYSFQRRPAYYTRIVSSYGLDYTWSGRMNSDVVHKLNLVDVNYIHLPELDSEFQEQLSVGALKYSFSDQFIIGTSYTFSKTNIDKVNKWEKPVYSLITSVESAGNTLYLISELAKLKKNKDGEREIFGTKFAQYLRGTFDYSRTFLIDDNNSIAWHVGTGLVYPYGNFKEVPIQKRFFAGGANSIRGWSVSDLGPGSFRASKKDYDNFFYHSGEMKFVLNVEYRSKLFWILELAAFADFGNIWTLKDDELRPGGQFKFDKFYKQIAASWGLGLRFDFNYFLLRVDCGFKAYNPAQSNGEKNFHWPILYPNKLSQNAALHVGIGYPF